MTNPPSPILTESISGINAPCIKNTTNIAIHPTQIKAIKNLNVAIVISLIFLKSNNTCYLNLLHHVYFQLNTYDNILLYYLL